MPQLIVGHTTDSTVRIWMRGENCWACDVALWPHPEHGDATRSIDLSANTDYTGIVDFDCLARNVEYVATARFMPSNEEVTGRFRTMKAAAGEREPFSFILSSCNLSVTNISNLLAFLLAVGGTLAASMSLDLPLDRWRYIPFIWLRRLLRPFFRVVLRIIAGIIRGVTGVRQPAPPQLRSPFVKLAAVFEAQLVTVVPTLVGGKPVTTPTVGDVIRTDNASGVLASAVTRSGTNQAQTWTLVLTQVQGTFRVDDVVRKRMALDESNTEQFFGAVTKVEKSEPWYEPPSFFMHVGDQIYYDFPYETRAPDLHEYRVAYREAFFDDVSNAYVLSHWPHYMTLDDHEIADQFALDFTPPDAAYPSSDYLEAARGAYREYVQGRNPDRTLRAGAEAAVGPFWYTFRQCGARYFVLDTRTRRINRIAANEGQIIDDEQMAALLAWLDEYRGDLKFVVTSVPFVAQFNDDLDPTDRPPTWVDEETSPNDPDDKWSALRFARQRHQIIRHIFDNGIEYVVFLTGDMHCCYHAAMRIGNGRKYECITVHELAAGPVNQLQLADIKEFVTRHAGEVPRGDDDPLPYEIVLDRFHTEVNAVMHLGVRYVPDPTTKAPAQVPEVAWNVIRTVTDTGATAWRAADPFRAGSGSPDQPSRGIIKIAGQEPIRPFEPTMSGRIRFARRRQSADLPNWG